MMKDYKQVYKEACIKHFYGAGWLSKEYKYRCDIYLPGPQNLNHVSYKKF